MAKINILKTVDIFPGSLKCGRYPHTLAEIFRKSEKIQAFPRRLLGGKNTNISVQGRLQSFANNLA
jgi:hypothetical protein